MTTARQWLSFRPRQLHTARLALGLSWIALVGCTSTPLPPWNPVAVPGSTVPAKPSQPSLPPAVVVTPEPVGAVSQVPAGAAAAASPAAAPYGQAVSNRFPEPATLYRTPGLQPDRVAFTSDVEIQAWMREQVSLAARSNATTKAAMVPIGVSQRGEPLEALVLTRGGGTDGPSLIATGRPTVLLIAQQHGDEPAGGEALLIIARELTQGLLQPLLERINVIIVARANPDGAAKGMRVASNGLDLNRDHLLLNTPEAQALARLARDYRPTVLVDVHEYSPVSRFVEKFGAIQKFDALFQYATAANQPEFLTKAAEEWYRRPLLNALKTQGLSMEWYYTTSADPLDKKISMGGTEPDTARNVGGLKNMVSLLLETRGGGLGRLHLQRRVHTHVAALSSILSSTAQRSGELMQLRPYIDRELSAQACKGETVVEAASTPAQYELVMLDPQTGADKTVTVDWNSALSLRKLKTRVRPCGYWLAGSAARAVDRLRLHGVQVMRLNEPGSFLGDIYRESSRVNAVRQDGRGAIADAEPIVAAEVSLVRGVIDAPRGSYYVPLNQALANLVIAALEPDTQSNYFANRLIENLGDVARVMAEPSGTLDPLP